MKRLLTLILVGILLSACWAPRCPMVDCDVAMEHRHANPKGTYSGRPIYTKYRFHNILSKKVREKNKGAGEGDEPEFKGKKAKKLFEWERE